MFTGSVRNNKALHVGPFVFEQPNHMCRNPLRILKIGDHSLVNVVAEFLTLEQNPETRRDWEWRSAIHDVLCGVIE